MRAIEETDALVLYVAKHSGEWGDDGALKKLPDWKGELLSALRYFATVDELVYVTAGVKEDVATVIAFTKSFVLWGTYDAQSGADVVGYPLTRLESISIADAPNARAGANALAAFSVEIEIAGKCLTLPVLPTAKESNREQLAVLVRSLTNLTF